jgi:hypothetical protein
MCTLNAIEQQLQLRLVGRSEQDQALKMILSWFLGPNMCVVAYDCLEG